MSNEINVPAAILSQELSPSDLHSSGDFSGINLTSHRSSNIESIESLYNGSLFENVRLSNCNFRSSEFTEASFVGCIFENIVFDRSDFVLMEISRCTFKDCSFNNAEWRETNIEETNFVGCEFRNTTISLCSFIHSDLDIDSSSSLIGQSKKYNVFSRSRWCPPSNDSVEYLRFIVDNFGLKDNKTQFILESSTVLQRLSNACLTEKQYTEEFVDLIVQALKEISINKGRNNIVKIKYICKICIMWSSDFYVSILARQYLIKAIEESAKYIEDNIVLFEVLSLIFKLRAMQIDELDTLESEVQALSKTLPEESYFTVVLDTDYRENEHEKLLSIAYLIDSSTKSGIKVVDVSEGSIIIEAVLLSMVSATAFLTTLGLALKSFKIVVKETTGILKAVKEFTKESGLTKNKESSARASNASGNVPALMRVFQTSTQDRRTETLASIVEQCKSDIFEFNYTSTVEVRSRK